MDVDNPDEFISIGGIAGYVDKSYITHSFYNGSIDNYISAINLINNPHAYTYIAGIAGYVNNKNIDTSTFIEKNISTGILATKVTAPKYSTTHVGGTVAYGANLNISAENYFYASGNNLFINDTLTIVQDLADYSSSDLFTHFTANHELNNNKLTEFFPAKIWNVSGMTVELKK